VVTDTKIFLDMAAQKPQEVASMLQDFQRLYTILDKIIRENNPDARKTSEPFSLNETIIYLREIIGGGPLETDQTILDLREAKYAVILFDSIELKGNNPKEIETILSSIGHKIIDYNNGGK
tara:strand:+ start:202 stop:564 length:363 start_codon:yes stop_codon:yes gene_type:complete